MDQEHQSVAVPGLITALADSFAAIRQTAAINLGRLGPSASSAIPALADALADADERVRCAAVSALGKIGLDSLGCLLGMLQDPAAGPAAGAALGNLDGAVFKLLVYQPDAEAAGWTATGRELLSRFTDMSSLTEAVDHTEEAVRIAALFALSQSGASGWSPTQAIYRILGEGRGRTRIATAAVIVGVIAPDRHEPPSTELINALVDALSEQEETTVKAAQCLLRRINRPAVSALSQALHSGMLAPQTAVRVIETLGEMRQSAAAAAPVLIELMQEHTALSSPAIRALGLVGSDDEQACLALLEATGNPETRQAALQALGRLNISAGKTVPALIGALSDAHPGVNSTAVSALVEIGAPAVPLLIDQLTVAQGKERHLVLAALVEMREQAAPAVANLVQVLGQDDAQAAALAAKALAAIGAKAVPAVPALTTALDSKDPTVQASAVEALGSIGEIAVPVLCDFLRRVKFKELRTITIAALGQTAAGAKEAVPQLMEALFDKDPTIQFQASEALQRMGPALAPVVPELVNSLMHNDRNVRSFAAAILGKIGPEARIAVQELIRTIKYGRIPARKSAAMILAKIANEAPEVIPALTGMLRSPDKDVVTAAAIALGSIGSDAAPAARHLIRAMGHRKALQDPSYRLVTGSLMREISTALIRMSPASVPAVISALQRSGVSIWDELFSKLPVWRHLHPPQVSKPRIKKQLVQTLGQIGPPAAAAVSVLVDLLQTDDSNVRADVAEALKSIGQASGASMGKLRRALKHRNPSVRAHTAAILGVLGRESRLAVPELIQALRDRDTEVRKRVIEALGEIGPHAREAVVPLLASLDTRDSEIAHTTSEALSKIGPTGAEAIKALTGLLHKRNVAARSYAARILGEMGAAALPAVNELQRLTKDRDPGVAQEATVALSRIQPSEPTR